MLERVVKNKRVGFVTVRNALCEKESSCVRLYVGGCEYLWSVWFSKVCRGAPTGQKLQKQNRGVGGGHDLNREHSTREQ